MPNMIRFPYHNFRRKPAMIANANSSRGMIRVPVKPLAVKGQEGSVRISTLVSIPLATIGAFLGTAIQFHIIQESVARAQGLENVNYLDFMSRPEVSMDYLSVAASGLLGAFVGVGIAKFPALLDSNGKQ